MSTNQEARHAAVRASTGTALDYNSDWSALFDQASIPASEWDGRFLAWINAQLTTSYASLPQAMQAYAVSQGAYNWNAVTSLGSIGPVLLPSTRDWFTTTGSTYPCYSLATGPNCVYVASTNKTWFAWQAYNNSTATRDVHVCVYDHATNTWGTEYIAGTNGINGDDHGVPNLCRLATGKWAIFYGSHGGTQFWTLSTNVDDPSAWTEQTPFAASATYPHGDLIGTTLYLFNRRTNAGDITAQAMPLFLNKITFDGSDNLTGTGTETVIASFGSNSRWYQGNHMVRSAGAKIHMVATRADYGDTYRRNVYYLVYDVATDTLENYAGTVTGVALPANITTLDASFKLYDHSGSNFGNTPSLAFDALTGYPHVMFNDGPDGTQMYHMYWTGSAWSTPDFVTNIQDRFGGGNLYPYSDGRFGIFYVRDTQGLGWVRGGDTLYRERSAAGVWGSESVLRLADDFAMDTPAVIRDGHANARAMLYEASQSPLTPDQMRIWAYGDSGFVTWNKETGVGVRDAYFARLATPLTGNAAIYVANYYQQRVNRGDWSGVGCGTIDSKILAVQASADTGVNAKAATFAGALVGTMAFVAGIGVHGAAAGDALNTGMAPSTAGGDYKINANRISWFCLDDVQLAGVNDMGCTGPSSQTHCSTRDTSNTYAQRSNCTSAITGANANSSGYFTQQRRGSAPQDLYREGVLVASASTQAAAILPNKTIYIGNRQGALNTAINTRRYALYDAGGVRSPNQEKWAAIDARTLLHGIGAV